MTSTRHLNQRLAAHASIRQLRVNADAEAAAARVDRAIAGLWRQLLAVLRHDHGYHGNYERALAIFRHMPHAITASLDLSFRELYHAGHRTAADATVDVLPLRAVQRLLGRLGHEAITREQKTEAGHLLRFLSGRGLARRLGAGHGAYDRSPLRQPQLLPSQSAHLSGGQRRAQLSEDEGEFIDPEHPFAGFLFGSEPPGTLTTAPILAATGPDGLRQALRDVLFPPPAESEVRHFLAPLVRPFDWMTLGGDAARKIPEDLATQYANLVSQGLSQRDIAGKIQPYLDGSRVRARRFARTFGAYVAHQAQTDADEGLGDLLDGYQIRAVFDEHTRAWHAARSGTIYYKNPRPDQLGFDHMPRPPLESPDPRDRPAGTPSTAFH